MRKGTYRVNRLQDAPHASDSGQVDGGISRRVRTTMVPPCLADVPGGGVRPATRGRRIRSRQSDHVYTPREIAIKTPIASPPTRQLNPVWTLGGFAPGESIRPFNTNQTRGSAR